MSSTLMCLESKLLSGNIDYSSPVFPGKWKEIYCIPKKSLFSCEHFCFNYDLQKNFFCLVRKQGEKWNFSCFFFFVFVLICFLQLSNFLNRNVHILSFVFVWTKRTNWRPSKNRKGQKNSKNLPAPEKRLCSCILKQILASMNLCLFVDTLHISKLKQSVRQVCFLRRSAWSRKGIAF